MLKCVLITVTEVYLIMKHWVTLSFAKTKLSNFNLRPKQFDLRPNKYAKREVTVNFCLIPTYKNQITSSFA